MKLIKTTIAVMAVAACSQASDSPDLLRAGDTLYIRGLALGETSTGAAVDERVVEDCGTNEALAAITGPKDYCRIRNTEFLSAETTKNSINFAGGKLSSLHIEASSAAFEQYVGFITARLGEPTSPQAGADGVIPNGEANINDGEGRAVKSDYRIWDSPIAYVEVYEKASGKAGQLRLMIVEPVT